jgi:hypothetical protein
MRELELRRCGPARRSVGSSTRACLAAVALSAVTCGARAEPWLEVGDRSVRSDLEIVAAAGLIDDVVTTWPIPKGQILQGLADQERLARQPEYVQEAAQHLLATFYQHADGLQPVGSGRFTNRADVIRDFGTLARNDVDVRGGGEWNGNWFDAKALIGDQSRFNTHETRLSFDDSFVSARAGNWLFYGGWVQHWYGPGQVSSLVLSNNARPFPKVGLMRDNPHAFETPWLSWLGPWQFDTFVGVLDGPRVDANTIQAGVRLTFAPLPHTEIGITRMSQLCGQHHVCHPLTAEFHFQNSDSNTSPTSDQGAVDVKYTGTFRGVVISPYAQLMNRDNGPFTHSDTSYLVGTSLAGALGDGSARWRVTAEYTDTLPTFNWFSFGKLDYGDSYNDFKYTDGKRYRGQSLGFSLDSDSRLFALVGLLTDKGGWTYRFAYYRANINSEQLAGLVPAVYPNQVYDPGVAYNAVSARPVQINQAESGLMIPHGRWRFELDLRAQDRQPYPRGGGLFSGEAGISYGF